jgi:nucleotide-binding universal stress UspA family protein
MHNRILDCLFRGGGREVVALQEEIMVKLKRILMATDLSAYSKEALDYAVYLAQSLKAELYLLHVFEIPHFSHTGVSPSIQPEVHKWIEQVSQEESNKLRALVEEVRQHGVNVSGIFQEGKPFVEILKTAGKIEADLIVLGTHGRTGMAHILIGSVAEKVVRQASCPVFTVRPKAFIAAKGGKAQSG